MFKSVQEHSRWSIKYVTRSSRLFFYHQQKVWSLHNIKAKSTWHVICQSTSLFKIYRKINQQKMFLVRFTGVLIRKYCIYTENSRLILNGFQIVFWHAAIQAVYLLFTAFPLPTSPVPPPFQIMPQIEGPP